jgi:D-alanyl-D-alanine carboxypeptidase (penicillin-binding protein 5/6)
MQSSLLNRFSNESDRKEKIKTVFKIASLFILGLVFLLSLAQVYRPKQKEIISPLSENKSLVVLGSEVKPFFYSTNVWLPDDKEILPSRYQRPEISAKAALVVNLSTDKIFYAKNDHERLPVASTLKIMTATVALERKNPNDIFTVSENAAKVGEDFMGITVGEKYTLEELLYGLLLPSGNDAAVAIAENIAGTESEFVRLMNEKTKLLGAKDTKFINTTGLQGDGEHYSTAYDMAIIARYAWVNFPLFRQIVGTFSYEIPYSKDHKYLYFENQTNLLRTYPGVKGIKPGFTPEAGLCLVTLAENGGHQILGVILGSNDRRGEMQMLLDYSFSTLGIKI